MTDESSVKRIFGGTTPRSRCLRGVLIATILTPLLLVLVITQGLASFEATLVSIGSGLIAGVAATVLLDQFQIQGISDVTITLGMLVLVVGFTALLWVALPTDHIATFLVFAIVFAWSLPLTSFIFHFVWPAKANSV